MTKKYPWTWQHMFRPSVHHRPPFPMTTRERLYEIRKRCRKTEIPSVRVWAVDEKTQDFCDFCLNLEDGECFADDVFGCPYAHDYHAFRCRVEAKARFHRMSRKERLYERRKRREIRVLLALHTCHRTKHPKFFRDWNHCIYLCSRARLLYYDFRAKNK